MAELLEVKRLFTRFHTEDGVVPAVQNVSFHVGHGESLGIVGESGCGKSVTCLSVMRLIPTPGVINADSVKLDGKELLDLSERKMQNVRGNEMAFIFQEPMTSFNPVFTIGYQLEEAIRLHQKLDKVRAREESISALKAVGIPRPEQVVDEYPHALSGGMRQRAMIAMAISCKPKLIFADEPTTALDVTIQAQVLELLNELKKSLNTAIVYISHDLAVIAEMTERVLVMYCGYIVENADIDSLFKNPKHPYTVGLLNSKPDLKREDEKLKPIPGTVPNPLHLPKGCPYHPRCEHAMDICRERLPEVTTVSDDEGTEKPHQVRCWLYPENNTTREDTSK